MTTFPLAVYTAGHGLDWNYPKAEIPFDSLDACRKAFGPLPDFDAGEKGFEGVWATADMVFALKCQSVRAWDFRGRDATYLSVTWVSRAKAPEIDFERLLRSDAMRVPTKTPPAFFEIDATKDRIALIASNAGKNLEDFTCSGDVIAETSPEDDLLFKRVDGVPGVSCVVRPHRDPRDNMNCERREAPVQLKVDCDVSERHGEEERHRHPLATCLVALTLLWIATAVAGGLVYMKLRQTKDRCEALRNEVERLERELVERHAPCLYPETTRHWAQDVWGLNVLKWATKEGK